MGVNRFNIGDIASSSPEVTRVLENLPKNIFLWNGHDTGHAFRAEVVEERIVIYRPTEHPKMDRVNCRLDFANIDPNFQFTGNTDNSTDFTYCAGVMPYRFTLVHEPLGLGDLRLARRYEAPSPIED